MNDSKTAAAGEFPPAISKPAMRALAGAGISSYGQLTAATAADLLQLHGVGPKAVRILRAELALRGLAFDGE